MKKGFLTLATLLTAGMLAACGGAGGGSAAMPAACATENACAVFAAGEPIHIGVGAPMTGDVSAFGIDASQSAMLAAKDAGAFEGHAFELVVEDDQGTPEGGAAVAQKFAADTTIVAVMGHSFSGATNAAMPIYETALLPMMSESATRIDLSTLGNKSFNRVVASDAFQGELAANFAYTDLSAKKLAVIHDGSPYGQGLAERARDVFKELGGEVVAFEAITVGELDYSAVLTKISALEPDAVYFGGYTGEAAVLANNRAADAILSKKPFMSGDGIFGSQFIDLAGDNATGIFTTNAAEPADSDAKTAFDAAYKTAYGKDAGELSGYTWTSYDATMVLIEAIKKVAVVAGDKLYIPRQALMDAVRGTTGYKGLTGEVNCDANGECSKGGFGVFVVEGGKWVAKK
jgi:branched-chain amino acid transport system substrate-binding protein